MSDVLEAAVWVALGLAAASWLLPVAGPAAAGVAAFAGVAAGAGRWVGASFRRLRAIELTPDGRLRLDHGNGSVESAPAGGHRVIGSTVCLCWRSSGPGRHRIPGGVWLTPRDVPAAELRRLAVGLRCAGRLEM